MIYVLGEHILQNDPNVYTVECVMLCLMISAEQIVQINKDQINRWVSIPPDEQCVTLLCNVLEISGAEAQHSIGPQGLNAD